MGNTIVKLNEIQAYCLHRSVFRDRKNKFHNMCYDLGIQYSFVESDTIDYTKQQNVAYDLIALIIKAIQKNIYPFIIFEDDAQLIDTIPSIIKIPEEADLIYWGASSYTTTGQNKPLYLLDYNEDYYRIFNTQSGHAIIVPNYNSTLLIKNILLESLIKNTYHDILLPQSSNKYLFLTPKDGPYFYQKDNSNEAVTNFKWKTSNILVKKHENI